MVTVGERARHKAQPMPSAKLSANNLSAAVAVLKGRTTTDGSSREICAVPDIV
jgi:hypothetical protein